MCVELFFVVSDTMSVTVTDTEIVTDQFHWELHNKQ